MVRIVLQVRGGALSKNGMALPVLTREGRIFTYMTPTIAPSPQPPILDPAILSQLASHRGCCVTVLLPANHPGAAGGSRRAMIESLFHGLNSPDASQLRSRIEEVLVAHQLQGGGMGLAAVAGSGYLEVYRVPVETAQLKQEDHPFLLPLLPEVLRPQEFFILSLGEKQLRLMHYAHGEATRVELPDGMIKGLEEFRHREDHGDQNRENRSSAGSAPGAMGALRFGTLSEREDAHMHREHFFARADESLAPLVGQGRLLLMGLDEQVADFRRVGKHCALFADHLPHPAGRDLPVREIAQKARACAQHDYRARGVEVVGQIREMARRQLALEGNEEVLDAARAGRVHRLCVPEVASASSEEQTLWNAAAAETLNHKGEVFIVDVIQALAARLRY